MATKTIDEIKAKKQEALRRFNREIQLIKTRENAVNRKATNRRLFLIGAFITPDDVKSGAFPEHPAQIVLDLQKFAQWLTRDADRAIFGLPPLKSTPPAVAVPEVPKARTDIEVPYEMDKEAKALGAKWDEEKETWYIPDGVDTTPFTLNGWLK